MVGNEMQLSMNCRDVSFLTGGDNVDYGNITTSINTLSSATIHQPPQFHLHELPQHASSVPQCNGRLL